MRSALFHSLRLMALTALTAFPVGGALAAGTGPQSGMVAHKALYQVKLVSVHSGAQVQNIGGDMFYETRASCDSWLTDNRFRLVYDYAETPQVRMTSDFKTVESFDGKSLDFSSRRKRDGELVEEVRGKASLTEAGTGKAAYSLPDGLAFQLAAPSYFPIAHTAEVIRRAKAGQKFFSAAVFDGSDSEGPVDISAFIIRRATDKDIPPPANGIDAKLLKSPAWVMRMAFFPKDGRESASEYEMTFTLHENGIISTMLLDYEDFSVTQTLSALSPQPPEPCDPAPTPAPADRLRK